MEDVDESARRRRIAIADRRIGEKASHINAAYAGLLIEIAEMDSLRGWAHQGARSVEEWIGWRIGVTPAEARHHVRIARKLGELPEIFGSFRRGELSYWQVRAIAPVATPEVEAELLKMARHSTAGQLQRLARAFKSCLDRAELELSNDRHQARSLGYHFDDDGFLQIHGRLTPDAGAVLVAALEQAEASLQADLPDDRAQRPTPEQIRADALAEVARGSLRAEAEGASIVPSVVVHVDIPSLIDGSGERCEIADGPSIASETARRLTCDCTLQTLYEVDGDVIDVGDRKRTVSPRMRIALEERDLTCVFPGCDRRKFTEAHHIVHWGHDGKTKLTNLALLCWHHHRLVHEGGFTMRAEPDMTFTFFGPKGSVVPNRPAVGNGDPGKLMELSKQDQLDIDDRTCTTLWDGRSISYVDCVHALLTEGGMVAKPRRGPPEPTSN